MKTPYAHTADELLDALFAEEKTPTPTPRAHTPEEDAAIDRAVRRVVDIHHADPRRVYALMLLLQQLDMPRNVGTSQALRACADLLDATLTTLDGIYGADLR